MLTRITFPSVLLALYGFLLFRRLNRMASTQIGGFVLARRWLADARTLMILSVWRDMGSLIEFSGTEDHVNAIRRTIAVNATTWSALFVPYGASSLSRGWLGDLEPWIQKQQKEAEG